MKKELLSRYSKRLRFALVQCSLAASLAFSLQANAGYIGGLDNRHLGDSGSCPNLNQGNPVNIATGNKYQKLPIYRNNNAFPLNFELHYNSRVRNYSIDKIQGLWTHSYSHAGVSQRNADSDTFITIIRPDGTHGTYELDNIQVNGDETTADVLPLDSFTPNTSHKPETGRLSAFSNTCSNNNIDLYPYKANTHTYRGVPSGGGSGGGIVIKGSNLRRAAHSPLVIPSGVGGGGGGVAPVLNPLKSTRKNVIDAGGVVPQPSGSDSAPAPTINITKDLPSCWTDVTLTIERPDGVTEIYRGVGATLSTLAYRLVELKKDGETQTLVYHFQGDRDVLNKIEVQHSNGQTLEIEVTEEAYSINHIAINRPLSMRVSSEDPAIDNDEVWWTFAYNDNQMLEDIRMHQPPLVPGIERVQNIGYFEYNAQQGSFDPNDPEEDEHGWLFGTALTNYYRGREIFDGDMQGPLWEIRNGHIAGWAYDNKGRAFRSYRGPKIENVDTISSSAFFASNVTEAYEYSMVTAQDQPVINLRSHYRIVKNHLGKELRFYFSMHDGAITPALTKITGNGTTNCVAGETDLSYLRKDNASDMNKGYDGQLSQVRSAKDYIKEFTYHKDGTGLLKTVTHQVTSPGSEINDGSGNVNIPVNSFNVHYTWTSDKKIKSVTTPDLITRVDYESHGRIKSIEYEDVLTNQPGLTHPSGVIEERVRKTTFEYSFISNSDRLDYMIVKGPRDSSSISQKTKIDYDNYGKIQSIISNYQPSQGIELAYQYTDYNVWGLPERIIDPNGLETRINYSPSAEGVNLTSIKVGSLNWYSIEYDRIFANRPTRITYPDESWVEFYYECGSDDDCLNRVDYILNNKGEKVEVTTTRTAGSDLTQTVVDYLSANAQMTYTSSVITDALDRVYQLTVGEEDVWWSLQTKNEFNYDADGHLQSVIEHGLDDQDNSFSTSRNFSLNGLGEITKIDEFTQSLQASTDIKFDNLIPNANKIIDAEGRETKYIYNGFGEVIQIDSEDTGITRYYYDKSGNVTLAYRAVGSSDESGVLYSYDNLNRLTAIASNQIDGSLEIVNLQYDYDADNPTLNFNWRGRLVSVHNTNSQLQEKAFFYYDNNGFRQFKSTGFPGGSQAQNVTFYNTKGQLTTENINTGGETSQAIGYSYDELGRVNKIVFDGQTLVDNVEYLPFGPVTSYTTPISGGTYQANYSKSYLGDTTEFETTSSGRLYYAIYDSTRGFANYDGYYEVTPNKPSSLGGWNSFTYDYAHRLTQMSNNGAQYNHTYEYNKIGDMQMHTYGSIDHDFSYTEFGDGSSQISSAHSTWKFGIDGDLTKKDNKLAKFDTRGRMTEFDGSKYTYNAFNQRTSKYNAQTQEYTYFEYDRNGQLAAERTEHLGLITHIRRYVYLNNRLVNVIDRNGTDWDIYTVTTNHLGAPVLLVNESGVVVWEMLYSPYGKPHHLFGTISFNIRMPGQYYDQETGFHYNMARYYDPELGRYLSSDPLGMVDGPNTYVYAGANPIKYVDPYGLEKLILFPERSQEYKVAIDIPDIPGQLTVFGHGTKDGKKIGPTRNAKDALNAKELLDVINEETDFSPGTPIDLAACFSARGENSIAEQLSKLVGENTKVTGYDGYIVIQSALPPFPNAIYPLPFFSREKSFCECGENESE